MDEYYLRVFQSSGLTVTKHTLLFISNYTLQGIWDSVVSIATGYELDNRETGVRVPAGSRIFSSPSRPNRLLGPINLLSSAYCELFVRRQNGRGVKLTSHLQLVPR
jgi:hypothetical protein